ncbi:hypothetical protein BDN72DRAFT_766702 [Pluteus cervinus]|uniref:Uncharacterized protein n=1 Tax=Pluteus cervinus TaxID=181527 RepID=A0ACD3AXP4_9AGAR|nr:hypothetical protein BDN72DRAFT_766702 [Pluteus cervinus]
MSLKRQQHPARGHLVFSAASVARSHTYLAATAFLTALVVGCLCHYKKIVKNSIAGYPEEWFPSVSATIGDWYPERSLFQFLIALTAGPRFALVAFQYYLHKTDNSSWPGLVFLAGLVRTLSCGGWVYITSSDHHDAHDAFMILYMVCNIPWMLGGLYCTPLAQIAVRRKRFFGTLFPFVYFFIQHKVHEIPGAYTHYSICEWTLIASDVLYDSVLAQELEEADLQVRFGPSPETGVTQDKSYLAPEKDNDPASSASIYRAWTPPRPLFTFLSDVYLSYIFWSIFTSLIPTLFYFSVWELGLAGQELALLSTLSPILLGIPSLRSWGSTRSGILILHCLSLSGIAAYALDNPIYRLGVVTFASIIVILRQAVQWSGVDGSDIRYQSITTILGFLLSSLSKHANHSNNPGKSTFDLWPFIRPSSGGYQKTGLIFAVLALFNVSRRPVTNPPPGSKSTSPPGPWAIPAIALGSVIFTLHSMMSDPSTLIAWSWTGYANGQPNGPLPHLHGSITLVVQCSGLLLPISFSDSSILLSPPWFAVGASSVYVLYAYRDWLGYSGGLVFAFWMMSITPLVFQRAASVGNVGKTYFTAWAVACVLNLASTFTVAYAFIPGGFIFRERTNMVLLAQMACISLVFKSSQLRPAPLSTSVAHYAKFILSFIAISAALVSIYRWPAPVQPFRPGQRMFNAGIWTLHFGIDNEGRDSQHGVRNLIRDMQLDVVGLLETDLHRTAFGNRDLTRVILEDMGYYVDLGPGPNSHTWGAVLLSKFPIINSTHHLLPSPGGELAPAIEAVLDIYGTEVTVVVSHNGQEEDPLDRELQSKELAKIMAAAQPRPVVFLGYVVTAPNAEPPAPYKILINEGQVHDIDKDDLDRWCEYILYRGLYRTSYVRVSRGSITDTELQIGQFVLPKHGHQITDDTEEARYLRAWKEEHPQERWFPMKYYKDQGGVDGHFYHVFDTPLYYNIPKGSVV